MGEKMIIDSTYLTEIADAIRYWNGKEIGYKPSEMAAAILALDAKRHGQSVLPDEYQEVEFLQSSGTQYISTDFYYDGVDDKQLRLVWSPTASMAGKAISGYEQSGVVMRWFFTNYGQAGQNAQYMLYANYNNSSQSILQAVGTKYDATFTAKNGTLSVNETLTGQSYSHSYTPTTSAFPNNKLRLFCNLPTQASSIQLYLAKMWSEGELKYELVPCYRKADKKPGMYDTVTDKFYINQGSGEFVCGPDV